MARQRWKSATEWGVVLAAFGVSGLFMGWMVGSSRSPVVATFLPLVFGLIGALSYGMIEKSRKTETLVNKIQRLDVGEAVRQEILSKLDLSLESRWSRMYWALGVILFCAASYSGIQLGLGQWFSGYSTTSELISEIEVTRSSLTPEEFAEVCGLRYRLEYLGIPHKEIKSVFNEFVKPTFKTQERDIKTFRYQVGKMLAGAEKSLAAIKKTEKEPFEEASHIKLKKQ
jgi:hypothetical protein